MTKLLHFGGGEAVEGQAVTQTEPDHTSLTVHQIEQVAFMEGEKATAMEPIVLGKPSTRMNSKNPRLKHTVLFGPHDLYIGAS